MSTSETAEFLADRVDCEPTVFKGLTSSELATMFTVSVLVWLPLSLIVGALFGRWMLGLAFGPLAILVTMYFGSIAFQRVKRNRPDHYYMHALKRLLHRLNLRRAKFVWTSNVWSLERTGAPTQIMDR